MKILVISSKETWAAKRLEQEAKKAKITLIFVTAEKLKNISHKDFDALYIRNPFVNASPQYLPTVVKLAKKFKAAGKKVVDSNIATGKLAQGKWVDYRNLMKAGLPIPKTRNYELGIRNYDYPLILKWNYGMKGKNVFLIRDKNQLRAILPLNLKEEWLVQEFIKADYEYKVVTVGYKALPVVSRFKVLGSGFRIDFASHKAVKKSAIPKIISIAEQASKLLGRELAKVDILQKDNRLYILEVNRFPGLEWFEKLTRYNSTKDFLQYLAKGAKKSIINS